ncbi:hypothetical protein Aduo_005169 [Ancylostoma duodenale]
MRFWAVRRGWSPSQDFVVPEVVTTSAPPPSGCSVAAVEVAMSPSDPLPSAMVNFEYSTVFFCSSPGVGHKCDDMH